MILQIIILLLSFGLIMGQGLAEENSQPSGKSQEMQPEEISPEDWEIIKNMSLLENMEFLKEEDISLLEEYNTISELYDVLDKEGETDE